MPKGGDLFRPRRRTVHEYCDAEFAPDGKSAARPPLVVAIYVDSTNVGGNVHFRAGRARLDRSRIGPGAARPHLRNRMVKIGRKRLGDPGKGASIR